MSRWIDRAKAISNAAQVIINGAKAEVDYIKPLAERWTGGFLASPRYPTTTEAYPEYLQDKRGKS